MPRYVLLPLLLLASFTRAEACQYCRMAATDPEAARMAAKLHAGGFPLDATINQFQPANPSAVMTAPPDPGSVTTSAADLPVLPRTPAPVSTPVPARTAGTAVATKATPKPVSWADAGLFGLLAAGGWFYWRTRREGAPVG